MLGLWWLELAELGKVGEVGDGGQWWVRQVDEDPGLKRDILSDIFRSRLYPW